MQKQCLNGNCKLKKNILSMNKLAKNKAVIFLVLTWILTSVFFIDSSNLLDIIAGKDYIVNHPDDDIYGSPDEDYYINANLHDYHNNSTGTKFLDNHQRLIKKVLVDQDSYSTESIKPFNEQIFIEFEKYICSLYSYRNSENSLFLKNCSLLI